MNRKWSVAVAQERWPKVPRTTEGPMVNLPATPRGPYRTGLRRREQIIEAATGIFARRGYTGATLREIADGAGVSTAGLRRHFGSKEKLLATVLDRWGCDSEALMDGAILGLRG